MAWDTGTRLSVRIFFFHRLSEWVSVEVLVVFGVGRELVSVRPYED